MKTRITNILTNFKAATTAVLAITAALIFAAAPVQSGQLKVDVCHKDTLISVAVPALNAHLNHGDTFPDPVDGCDIPLPPPVPL